MLQDVRNEYDPFVLNFRVLLVVFIFFGLWFSIPWLFRFGLVTDIIYLQFASFVLPLFATGLVIFLVYFRLARRVPIHWWIIGLSLVLGMALSWYSYNRLHDIVEKI
ncbi:MAG TPA: hypothetical protein PLN21_14685 [Gemmatales bacterium]|nr:hypothetical protein [Gemmatales bacterium]